MVVAAASVPAELPPTSLIVCSRNRPQLLLESIESILSGDEVPTELIIIDQSDEPHPMLAALRTARPCEIRYHWTHSTGLSRANNTGIAAARYDLLAFTHDDVLVTPGWLGALIRALLAAGPRAVVTGRVLPAPEQAPGGFAPSTKDDARPAIFRGRLLEDVLYPFNMALWRAAIVEVGDFDVRLGPGTPFPGAEDNDLAFRLLEAGYAIHYAPQVMLYHRAWRRREDYLPLRWGYGRAQGAFYAKYLSLRDRHMLRRFTGNIAPRLVQSARLARRDPLRAKGHLAYIAGMLTAVVSWCLLYGRRRSLRTAERRTHGSSP